MLKDLDLIDIIIVVLIFSPLFLVIFMVPIGDWLSAREKRKKDVAQAAAAAESPQAAADRIESIAKRAKPA